MSEPKRIQRKRTRGWRLPLGAVIVDRTSKWGNPFTIADAIEANYEEPARACVSYFAAWIADELDHADDTYTVSSRTFDRRWMREHLGELEGKDLCCPCSPGQPCHADVLLELAAGTAR